MSLPNVCLSLILCSISLVSWGQQSRVSGIVSEEINGQSQGIPFATVQIAGTTLGTSTDMEGKFELTVEPGTYTLVVSFIGFTPDTIPNIRVNKNQNRILNITLSEDTRRIQGVDITAKRITNTETAVLVEIRKSEQVVSGISSEQITKSQDRNAAEVVRRIPGVTIIQDRFVMIRGLSERYNAVLLNGTLTPSAETDKKAFSFDIIPAGALDRILVYKTGAPELPGEFAGGVIKVFTKNVADSNSIRFGVSGSYRATTTFQDFYHGGRSNTDWLGFDNGLRKLPDNFPVANLRTINNRNELVSISRLLPNSWTLNNQTAPPDLRFKCSITRVLKTKKIKVGSITAFGYSNTYQFYEATNFVYNIFNEDLGSSEMIYDYLDDVYQQTNRWSVIHNWSLIFNPNHSLEIRNLFNQTGINEATLRTGSNFEESSDVRNFSFRYRSRSIYSGQVQGNHQVANEKVDLDWIAGYSHVIAQEPDFRRIRTVRNLGDTAEPYRVIIAPSASILDAGRFYADLTEQVAQAGLNYTHEITTSGDYTFKIRAGTYFENKTRDFAARWMSYNRARISQFDNDLLLLPIDQIFEEENLNDSTGFILDEGTNPSDRYDASNRLIAGYVGGSFPIAGKINISGGLRIEHNDQELTSEDASGNPVLVDNPITSVLPSLNTSYSFTEKSLVRLAYSKTVNRPEFRELAPFSFYDFNFNVIIAGNSDLLTPDIHNADLRWEFYPKRGEVVNVAAFFKYFINPIEMFFVPGSGSGGTKDFTFGNADYSYSAGGEIEIRKKLDFLPSKFLSNMAVLLNAAYIFSRVELGTQAVGQSNNRPMMGQSPYIINAGLYYNNTKTKLQFNLLYNVIGRRIFAVGTSINPDYYEMPRNVLDLTITKGFGKHIELKAGIQDILNQEAQIVQDSDNDGKITDIDEEIQSFRPGQYITVGITAKF